MTLPLPKLVLDPNDDQALLDQRQQRLLSASVGSDGKPTLTDFRKGSVLSALGEAEVYTVGFLLYYLNLLPEATAIEIFRLFEVSRSEGRKARGELTFLLESPLEVSYDIPAGFSFAYDDSVNFTLLTPLNIPARSFEGRALVEVSEPGSAYNFPALAVSLPVPELQYVQSVYNELPFDGGEDLETLESAISRGQFELRTHNTLVTVPDFEEYSQRYLGQGSKAKCVPWLGSNKVEEVEGQLHVFAVGSNQEPPTVTVCQDLRSALESSTFAASRVWVSPADKVLINIDLTVRAESADQNTADLIYDVIAGYIVNGVSIGEQVDINEIAYLARSVPGVITVTDKLINNNGISFSLPNLYSYPYLEVLTVNLVDITGLSRQFSYGTTIGDPD